MNNNNKFKKTAIAIFVVLLVAAFIIYHLQRRPLNVVVISFNDLQSQLLPTNNANNPNEKDNIPTGGLAYMAKVIKELKVEYPEAIILEAGDLVSGISWRLFEGAPETRAANLMGVNAGTLGNHEFHLGLKGLYAIINSADFPLLAANATFEDPTINKRITDFTIIDSSNGVKIGIFGLLIPELTYVSSGKAGVKINPNTAKVAQKMVKELKQQGAQVIIAVTHLGLESDIKLAQQVSGIHAIISGHSYTPTKEKLVVKGPNNWSTVIAQSTSHGQGVGLLKLTVRNGKLDLHRLEWQLIAVKANTSPDPGVDKMLKTYVEEIESTLSAPIGRFLNSADATKISSRTKETGLGNILADAFKWKLNTDIAFMNSGSIRSNQVFQPSDVSMMSIYSILPFNDSLWHFELSGREIREILEISASALIGNEDNFLASHRPPSGGFLQISGLRVIIGLNAINKPILINNNGKIISPGNRVKAVQVFKDKSWQLLKDDEIYSVAALTFIATGGDKHITFKNNNTKTNTEIIDSEAVAAYITEYLEGEIDPINDGRITIDN